MSNVKPFKAVIYNQKKIKDLTKVVAPPYDVIDEEEQMRLHSASKYNFTHIDFGKENPKDDKSDNKYTRAKKIFSEWFEKEILVQEEKPGIYFYKQEYKILGQKHSRTGFVSVLEIEDEEASLVVPHEKTHAKAVNDRLDLTRSLNANLSSIFVCYSDKQKKIDKIFNKYVLGTEPLINIVDDDKVKHIVWKLEDSEMIQTINAVVSGQHLFIADGHHRYKVATLYRAEKYARKTTAKTGQEPFNYVMTYFTNIDSRDLQIFPMHRIVISFPESLGFLEEYFRIDRVKSKEELLILLARAGRNEHAFGYYTRDGIKLLRLKNKLLIDEHIKEGSREYKSLDATILKSFIFDKVGIDSKDIVYTKDLSTATDMVDNFDAEVSFIMNPVKIGQLKSIALNGEKMPPKTTYFYPKVLSGLLVYKMD